MVSMFKGTALTRTAKIKRRIPGEGKENWDSLISWMTGALSKKLKNE